MDIVQKVKDAAGILKNNEEFKSEIFIIDTSDFTKEELKEWIKRAYEEGYKEGLKESQKVISPSLPSPAWLDWTTPTCCNLYTQYNY